MNSNCSPRIPVMLGVVAGGLVAAAFLSTAVANADQYVYEADPTSFVVESPFSTGFFPISFQPFFSQSTGSIDFNVIDVTTKTVISPDAMKGTDLLTNFFGGSWGEFEIFHESSWNSTAVGALNPGTLILESISPGGFDNELILSSSVPFGLEDIFITPSGVLIF